MIEKDVLDYEQALAYFERAARALDQAYRGDAGKVGADGRIQTAAGFRWACRQIETAVAAGTQIGVLANGTRLYTDPRYEGKPHAVKRWPGHWELIGVIGSQADRAYPVTVSLVDSLPTGWLTWAEREEGAPSDVAYPPSA